VGLGNMGSSENIGSEKKNDCLKILFQKNNCITIGVKKYFF